MHVYQDVSYQISLYHSSNCIIRRQSLAADLNTVGRGRRQDGDNYRILCLEHFKEGLKLSIP